MDDRAVVLVAKRAMRSCSFATQSVVQLQTLLPNGVKAECIL